MFSREKMKDNVLIIVASVFIIFLLVYIFGYQSQKQGKKFIVEETQQVFKVIKVKQPKHFRMDLLDEKSGKVYENVYISKHCMNWKNLEINSEYTFKKITYRYEKTQEEKTQVDIGNGLDFCQNLKK